MLGLTGLMLYTLVVWIALYRFANKVFVVRVEAIEKTADGWITLHPVPYHNYVAIMVSKERALAHLRRQHPKYFTDEWTITIKQIDQWESLDR